MFQCENDLYESKCIKITTTTTTTTTTECFLKARQKNSDALKKILTSNSQKMKQIVASPKCLPLE